jgi:ribosomal-protein-alanine N-acetyltransferase
MNIRVLTATDIAAVVAIAKMSMPYAWNESVFQDCLRDNYHGWVIETAHEIIGFVIILLQGDEAQLMNIAVKPAYQQQGHATQLLQQAIQFARVHQAKKMLLEVRASNLSAIQFYKKWHAQQIATRKNYYPCDQGREDALIFTLWVVNV